MAGNRLAGIERAGLLAAACVVLMVLVGCAPGGAKPATGEPAQRPAVEPAPAPEPAPTPAMEPEPAPEPSPEPTPAPQAPTGRVDYAPGVTIDWSVPQVEVDALVSLREGPVKLLACTAGTKEQESILATEARARRVYEALGLIGLEAGHPGGHDEQPDQDIKADGQRVMLAVEYDREGEPVVAVAQEWLRRADTEQPSDPLAWVFCGSRLIDGRFGADVEGTVVSVVDFDTALIGLAVGQSTDAEPLEFLANSGMIPEKGTPCKLIVRALQDETLVLALTPEWFFQWNDTVLSAEQLDELIKERLQYNPGQKVHLSALEGVELPVVKLAAQCIIGSGIARENMTLDLARFAESAEESSDATPADSQEEPGATATDD